MDTDFSSFSISPAALLRCLGTADAPVLLDVRRDAAFAASAQMIAGALRCAPQDVAAWAQAHRELRDVPVVVYCVYGHQVSQEAARQLRALGFQAKFLLGGMLAGEDGVDAPSDIAAWRALALPLCRRAQSSQGGAL